MCDLSAHSSLCTFGATFPWLEAEVCDIAFINVDSPCLHISFLTAVIQEQHLPMLQRYQHGQSHQCKQRLTQTASLLQIVLPLGDEPNKRAGKNPKRDSEVYPIEGKTVTSQTGEIGIVRRSPDMEALKEALQV